MCAKMVRSETCIVNVAGLEPTSDKRYNSADDIKSADDIHSADDTSSANNTNVVRSKPEDKIYSYEEAIDLTGNGSYNCGLLAVLSLGLLGMGIDIFGFSVIVTGCACDFELEHWQRNVMLSMPFVGPIIMAMAWGYVSDTQGRRQALFVALWGSFIFSIISAFSLNWIMLTILKVVSSSFAIQSVAYPLINESCASTVRSVYMLIMTSFLMLFILTYVVPAYFILQLTFAYNLGILTFTPWRLLTILLAAPLGISAFMLNFYYESPKFLVNIGREDQALKYLAKIWARNRRIVDEYPVRKIMFNEGKGFQKQEVHILRSLRQQIIPLFEPPLLWKTSQLFYLTTVIYCVNNSLVMWMPYIIEVFTSDTNLQTYDGSRSLCSIIKLKAKPVDSSNTTACSSSIRSHTLLSGIIHGLVFASINLLLSRLASKKKVLMMTFLLIPALSSLAAIFIQNNLASLVLYGSMTMTTLCVGVLFSYYVELYPTSYSGMAACLGVMVARISGLAGVNFLGIFMMTHCSMTFYVFAAYLMSGVVVAMYLPPDIKAKEG